MHRTVKHFASPEFWTCYRKLPKAVRKVADQNFELLKTNPRHSSLHLKKVGRYRSVRVGAGHRALGAECADGIVWFWIGSHGNYDKLLRQ
ncbi:MAG: hypothetical protein ABIF82_07665 [Planctomycetota bacterium]